MPPAARITDMHTCPMVTPGTPPVPHAGGPVSAGAPTVQIGFLLAARAGDACVCVGPPDMIAKGSPTVHICGMPAARLGDLTIHGGALSAGLPTVLIGDFGMGAGGVVGAVPKTLKLKIVIVKGTHWDSDAGRKEIARQIAEAERILGIKIDTGAWETVDDSSMKSFPIGKWDGTNNYSQELVDAANTHGAADKPAMIFTDNVDTADAITVGKAWAGTDDGLNNEAIVVANDSSAAPGKSSVVAHELGHLLSGETGADLHGTDKNNLMWDTGDRTGTEWTDPWKSAADANPYLK